ncbi:hypothetical protein QTO34_006315 [Cnephaeus nilssonii]|uniref:Cytochrome c oxidase subunit 5B, mitochondrial n=1 Tax=Cnephaeus nilssonii TaxID=3371016 RepID=A0AA40HKA3_CNENI|nr:hypothetical protein QTO34_006315 [Eptesicus nilssonii]
MASRLLRGTGALVAQALRARGPNAVAAVRSMASGGGVPTDDEQATGLEREVMLAARKGLVSRNFFLSLELMTLDGTRAFSSLGAFDPGNLSVVTSAGPIQYASPKGASGTKEDPNLVPSITNKRIVGCICEEDNSAVIWFWVHKGETQRCPSCGTHYKLVPHQLSH